MFFKAERTLVEEKKMRRFLILSLLVVCSAGMFLCGCENGVRSKVKEVVKPSKGKALTASCIVTFYKSDGSRYLSEQKHLMNPSSGVIEITSEEPGGKVSCRLDGGFVKSGQAKVKDLPISMCDRNLAQVIWASVAGGCGFLSEKSGKKGDEVKMEGRWYEPITAAAKSQWAETILYKNVSDGAIEMVQVVDSENGKVLTARSYNYFWFEDLGRRFPMKIDVFSSDKVEGDQKQILEISYQLPIGWN
jgi:hypothetical protein